jgi:hypothetical protein
MAKVAAMDEFRVDLPVKEQSIINPYSQKFEYQDIPSKPPKGLNLYLTPDELEFLSSDKTSLYIFNETEYAVAIQTGWNWGTLVPKKAWTNITELNIQLSYKLLHEEWGVENKTVEDTKTGDKMGSVTLWVVVVNEMDTATSISLKWQTRSTIINNLDITFEMLLPIVFFYLAVLLLIQRKKETQNNESMKAQIYLNYGLGLLIGGVAATIWVVYRTLRLENPMVTWSEALNFSEMPIEGITANLLFLITLVCLGGSVVFISNTVERNIQRKQKPHFTYLLILMEFLIIGVTSLLKMYGNSTALDGVFIMTFWIWIVIFLLTGINVLLTYLKLVIQTTGIIRRKSGIIFIGALFTFVLIGLRDFIHPQFIASLLGAVFAIVLYKGIIMDMKE